MSKLPTVTISFVIPLYNEAIGLPVFHQSLVDVIKQSVKRSYEIIYCNDGSTDDTLSTLKVLAKHDTTIRIMSLSRNFGKEIATTAGMHIARGEAIMTLDADGQHPVELIPKFIEHWENGGKVVVGIRVRNQQEGPVKRIGSKLFYALFNRFTGSKLIPGLSDFRLIDRSVQQDFLRITERNRITRGLIDWLGYKQDYIKFTANPRLAGKASYSFPKLFKLAIDSIVSLSISPLYITAYIGAFVLPVSILLGLAMILNVLIGDPFNLHITGGAFVMVFMLFLIGILLVSQGIIGLYLSHIHTETQNRPLYVIDTDESLRLHEA